MLIPDYNQDIPESTVAATRSSFPKGNAYLTLRDNLGTIYQDEDFTDLFPELGQPALAPGRLVWERHYEQGGQKVRFKSKKELANAPPGRQWPKS